MIFKLFRGWLRDLFWFSVIHATNPNSDVVWRDFRATRRLDRREITNKKAYQTIYRSDKKEE